MRTCITMSLPPEEKEIGAGEAGPSTQALPARRAGDAQQAQLASPDELAHTIRQVWIPDPCDMCGHEGWILM